MGLGGALIWTAVFKNIKKQYPNKKIVYVYSQTFKSFLKGEKNGDFVIYENNKDLFLKLPFFIYRRVKFLFWDKVFFVVDTTKKEVSIHDKVEDGKIFYKSGKHMVDYLCEGLEIEVSTYHPTISLTKLELKDVNRKVHELSDEYEFICIEPNFKENFTVNKAWFWDRWQDLVDSINAHFAENNQSIKVVQIGAPKSKVLDGVIDLTNKGLSFRETSAILQKSKLFVGYMGGLVHLNKSVGGKSVVLISGFEPLELGSYQDDINIYKKQDCNNCGLLLTPCPIERKCMQDISVEEVFSSIIKNIKG